LITKQLSRITYRRNVYLPIIFIFSIIQKLTVRQTAHFINISNEIVNKTRFLHTSEQNQNVRRQTHLPQVHGEYPAIVEHVAARGQQMFLFPQAILRNVNPHRHDSSRCGGHDDAILR
jgi:hypothetical protein